MNSDADADADPRGFFNAAAADRDRDPAKSVAERRILYTRSVIGMFRMALFLSQFIGCIFPRFD